jgi:hypothetical protein
MLCSQSSAILNFTWNIPEGRRSRPKHVASVTCINTLVKTDHTYFRHCLRMSARVRVFVVDNLFERVNECRM